MIHFLEATVKRSEENQYRSWGYCTYEVPWNDHSLKFTIFYSKILGDWNRKIFSDKVNVPRPYGFPWGSHSDRAATLMGSQSGMTDQQHHYGNLLKSTRIEK